VNKLILTCRNNPCLFYLLIIFFYW